VHRVRFCVVHREHAYATARAGGHAYTLESNPGALGILIYTLESKTGALGVLTFTLEY
jgi:non-ribosomal peptide synthetase component E (peptide arylation enzyme)